MADQTIIEDGRIVQVGVLVWRPSGDDLEFLLVSSRRTGRWLIPKGWPKAGVPLWRSAADEAWEEAGASIIISHYPVGSYIYIKIDEDPGQAYLVKVYDGELVELDDDFPEASFRKREWMSREKAMGIVDEAGLARLIAGFRRPS